MDLTHGQLLWTLCQGAMPQGSRRRLLLDQLRYLRQLSVPFAEHARGQGRGRPLHYSYEEVVETAVALYALRRGVRPHLVADYLVTNRTTLYPSFRTALEAHPPAKLTVSWLESPETPQALPAHESVPRQHHRRRTVSDPDDLVVWEVPHVAETQTRRPQQLFPDGPADTRIPLTRLVRELTYWAHQAPDIKAGRKGTGAPSPTPASRVRT